MHTLSAGSATELFTAACRCLRTHGSAVAPRGLATTELLGTHLHLTRPRYRFVDEAPARVINAAFAAAEAVWILSGSDEPWIFDFNKRLRRFTDHGRLQGAYGPRLRNWQGRDQLDTVRRVLEDDDQSRQAVIQLFNPARDFSGHRDVPCTLGYRFYIRSGRLVMFTTMRSQDTWLGFPYDIFTTTLLQELLAGWLGVGLGEYHHLVDSLHLYDDHLALAETLDTLPVGHQAEAGAQLDLRVPWEDFDTLLAQITAGELVGHAGWDDFAIVLASYRRWKAGDRDNARALLTGSDQLLSAALRRWYELLESEPHRIASAPATPNARGRLA
ncbi:thymidylate synthase [Saccharopolyspora elongata]|uniref:thymidylate synthase n=1 Tax=Saccharopolyspora elongata TaxID=2530387 RepID=A0A4R4Y7G2_9PSEU|nr:thymidylate synthase [Saccharopolyspora elongata]